MKRLYILSNVDSLTIAPLIAIRDGIRHLVAFTNFSDAEKYESGESVVLSIPTTYLLGFLKAQKLNGVTSLILDTSEIVLIDQILR